MKKICPLISCALALLLCAPSAAASDCTNDNLAGLWQWYRTPEQTKEQGRELLEFREDGLLLLTHVLPDGTRSYRQYRYYLSGRAILFKPSLPASAGWSICQLDSERRVSLLMTPALAEGEEAPADEVAGKRISTRQRAFLHRLRDDS